MDYHIIVYMSDIKLVKCATLDPLHFSLPIRLETITKRQTSGFGGGGFGMVNCGRVHKLNWGGMDKLLKSVVGLAPPENSFSHRFLTRGKFDRNAYSTLSPSERCGFFWGSPLLKNALLF